MPLAAVDDTVTARFVCMFRSRTTATSFTAKPGLDHAALDPLTEVVISVFSNRMRTKFASNASVNSRLKRLLSVTVLYADHTLPSSDLKTEKASTGHRNDTVRPESCCGASAIDPSGINETVMSADVTSSSDMNKVSTSPSLALPTSAFHVLSSANDATAESATFSDAKTFNDARENMSVPLVRAPVTTSRTESQERQDKLGPIL